MHLIAGLLSGIIAMNVGSASGPPPTTRKPVTESVHGVTIVDPYRWLEDQKSKETRAWIATQDKYSDSRIKNLPARSYLKKRFSDLARIDVTGQPIERNGRLFFSRKRVKDEQSVLYYRDGLDGQDHVVIDPQPLSKNHTTSADLEDASQDGRYVAYHIRSGGEDESTIHILDLQTRQELPDSLPRANYWGFSLKPDMTGYYYSVHINLVGARLRFHEMGTPHSDDKEIFGSNFGPEYSVGGDVTEDGKFLLIGVAKGWAKSEIYAMNLVDGGPVFPVITGFDSSYSPSYANGKLYVLTDKDAPTRHVIEVDLAHVERSNWHEVVPASKDSIQSCSIVGGKLFVQSLHNVVTRVQVFDLSGKSLGDLHLPGLGDSSNPTGRLQGHDAFYTFQSFSTPRTIYHVDVTNMKQVVWNRTRIPGLDPSKLVVRQEWATSKDGTKVPMFLVFKKGLSFDGKRPSIITGYGGFDSNELPYFSGLATILAENGGVYVSVTLRGGGEFGEGWHRAGMLANKQNVFEDLYAATRWLIQHKVTNATKDAVIGGSNGGLLVGTAITQHPELYQAALCEVPLLDMLRYHLFLQGPQWVPEYGSAVDPQQFKWLYAYSPYQHVKKGVKYPAVLFYTGDGDTRVAPLHARKMTALMQWATGSNRPILLHYETAFGHSGGESVTQRIDTNSLLFAFLFEQLGIKPK